MKFILTSITAFVSTNIDDTFLLMLFFGDRRFKAHEILIGQLLGIGSLVAISLVLSLIGLVIGEEYIGLLGLVPIYLGVRGLVKLFSKSEEREQESVDPPSGRGNVLSVAGVTIANGGDNIGIYTPLLATVAWDQKITMIIIFFIMTAALCSLAKYFTRHPIIARSVQRYGHLATPFVLILLGLFILYEGNTVNLLTADDRL